MIACGRKSNRSSPSTQKKDRTKTLSFHQTQNFWNPTPNRERSPSPAHPVHRKSALRETLLSLLGTKHMFASSQVHIWSTLPYNLSRAQGRGGLKGDVVPSSQERSSSLGHPPGCRPRCSPGSSAPRREKSRPGGQPWIKPKPLGL